MTEGVTFPEAVERLASMAGVPLPQFTPEAEAREERRKTLHDVVELAAKFFEATLQSRAGAKARGYLADRGIEPTTQLQFRIGYAPAERFALKEHLGAQGISVEDMIEAGLLVHGDDIPVPYDRFRDRVMFPITDLRGRVIAFGGRALEKDAPAKYLNSPETPLFHKGGTLYNGAAARQAAHDGATAHRGRRLCRRDRDGDGGLSGGRRAARHGADRGSARAAVEDGGRADALLRRRRRRPPRRLPRGRSRAAAHQAGQDRCSFALLPEGQDPDDLVRSGGREAIAEVIGAARPLADMLWQRETEAGGFDTPERRAGLDQRVAEVTNAIADPSVRKYYRQDLDAARRARCSRRLHATSSAPRWERRSFGEQSGAVAGQGPAGRDGPSPRETIGATERAACRQPDRARHRAARCRRARR